MYKISFYRAMKLAKEDIASKKDKPAGELWLRVKDFMVAGNFSKYKKAGQLSKSILEGYSDSYTARVLGVEESTVRVHINNLSKELYNLFGNDFFDLLKDYSTNKKEIERRLTGVETVQLSSRDVLPEELLILITKSPRFGTSLEKNDIDLSSCHAEISFLMRHSNSKLKSELSTLSIEKLNYLLDLIDLKVDATARGELLALLINKEEQVNAEN